MRTPSTPLSDWNKPRTVFVNSMSDLFHRDVPDDFILRVFETMVQCPEHKFSSAHQAGRSTGEIVPGDSLGRAMSGWEFSVEDSRQLQRVKSLRSTGAGTKFLSLEPLIGPLPELELEGISWVIVGGESGPKARPMEQSWVLDIRDRCEDAGVPFFFKQWGGKNKKKTGRMLEGRTYDSMPVADAVYQCGNILGRTPAEDLGAGGPQGAGTRMAGRPGVPPGTERLSGTPTPTKDEKPCNVSAARRFPSVMPSPTWTAPVKPIRVASPQARQVTGD